MAVREYEIFCKDESGEVNHKFKKITQSVEEYKYFMWRTGLFDLLENLVKNFLQKADVEFFEQMYLNDIEKNWRVDLSAISAGGTSTKRFDFVVKTAEKIFIIETNFYSSNGSKLNEVARSYKMLAQVENLKFIWITDGEGWKKAKNNLHETFLLLDTLYNIKDLENDIFITLFAPKNLKGS